jgi:50S ribosomal subunit-associated GTPase HflX
LIDLHLSEIPVILALNKADLIDPESMEAIVRQVQISGNETVAISAINPQSLEPLLEKAGFALARNLGTEPSQPRVYEPEALSRIA